MYPLEKIIDGIQFNKSIHHNDDLKISSIEFDSRNVIKNSLFVAIKGTQVDGHHYIETAIKNGAIAIVCEEIPLIQNQNIVYLQVKDAQSSLGFLAKNFYHNPSSHLQVIGIIGTNGKTSNAVMLYELFTKLGYKVGLLSTIKIQIGNETIAATHTTPDALSINKNLAFMVDKGCDYCFMEVSSHAIDQDRISGIQFKGGLFTNITHDHLDYHITFDNYLRAKKKFFDNLTRSSFALYNADDKNGKIMMQNTLATTKSFAINSLADYNVKILDLTLKYMTLRINQNELTVKLIGEFNAYNILSTYAVAMELGMNEKDVLIQISKLEPVEGRIDIVTSPIKKIKGVIDYAHTPDAVEKILAEVSKINKNGQMITLIGCGGNRDKAKRPIMAKIACNLSNRVILTNDNPRDEDPKTIIDEMKSGLSTDLLKKTITVLDRSEAIKTACMLAEENDIIIIVGKGHEKYQEVEGKKFPFDDKSELIKQFEEQGL